MQARLLVLLAVVLNVGMQNRGTSQKRVVYRLVSAQKWN